jgi:hypothetical protein
MVSLASMKRTAVTAAKQNIPREQLEELICVNHEAFGEAAAFRWCVKPKGLVAMPAGP